MPTIAILFGSFLGFALAVFGYLFLGITLLSALGLYIGTALTITLLSAVRVAEQRDAFPGL